MAFKKADFGKVRKRVKKPLLNLRLLGNEITVDIIKRTQTSKDRKGKSFKQYSQAYRKIKAEKYGVTKPNLTATGNMLNSITYKQISNGIRIYFNNANERQKALANIKRGYDFFGIDKVQLKNINKQLRK